MPTQPVKPPPNIIQTYGVPIEMITLETKLLDCGDRNVLSEALALFVKGTAITIISAKVTWSVIKGETVIVFLYSKLMMRTSKIVARNTH